MTSLSTDGRDTAETEEASSATSEPVNNLSVRYTVIFHHNTANNNNNNNFIKLWKYPEIGPTQKVAFYVCFVHQKYAMGPLLYRIGIASKC